MNHCNFCGYLFKAWEIQQDHHCYTYTLAGDTRPEECMGHDALCLKCIDKYRVDAREEGRLEGLKEALTLIKTLIHKEC